jgi:hypothetical protein
MAGAKMMTQVCRQFRKTNSGSFSNTWRIFRLPGGRIPGNFANPRNFREAGASGPKCATMRHFCSIGRLGLTICAGGLFRDFDDSTADFAPKSARKAAISAPFRPQE